MIGVLGGMGPLATVDFMKAMIAHTQAQQESDHVPLIVVSDPRVPAMGDAIFKGGPSPVPAMIAGIRRLEAGGASCIAIACHAAHHWIDALTAATPLPILHIADAVCDSLAAKAKPGSTIGVIAAASTQHSGFYQHRLEARGFRAVVPAAGMVEKAVMPGIKLVKAGQPEPAAPMFRLAVAELASAGASAVILACTEIPIAMNLQPQPQDAICIDGTEALAQSCIAWWQANKAGLAGQSTTSA